MHHSYALHVFASITDELLSSAGLLPESCVQWSLLCVAKSPRGV